MMTSARHPSGVRLIHTETTQVFGPEESEPKLLRALAGAITGGRIDDVQSITVDWRDDGCYLLVYCNSYVMMRSVDS
jgi:hypothetical protein